MPKFASQASDMLSDLKSRFGIAPKDTYDDYEGYEEYKDDEFEDDFYPVEDYVEDPYQGDYPYTDDPYARHDITRPRLVSYDDVRANQSRTRAEQAAQSAHLGLAIPSERPRQIKLIKPVEYADAEQVGRQLKAGNIVVLQLRAVPESLSKRLLDFSFGAASMVDAKVDCIARKVFVIASGAPLTEEEREQLRDQGIL